MQVVEWVASEDALEIVMIEKMYGDVSEILFVYLSHYLIFTYIVEFNSILY